MRAEIDFPNNPVPVVPGCALVSTPRHHTIQPTHFRITNNTVLHIFILFSPSTQSRSSYTSLSLLLLCNFAHRPARAYVPRSSSPPLPTPPLSLSRSPRATPLLEQQCNHVYTTSWSSPPSRFALPIQQSVCGRGDGGTYSREHFKRRCRGHATTLTDTT